MADLQELPQAVRSLAARYAGRLIVVSPTGTGGNPWEAPLLDAVRFAATRLELVLGGGHAHYVLQDPHVVSQDEDQLLLSGASLQVSFIPHGRGSGPRSSSYSPAELLLTADPTAADRRGRTRGRRLEEPRGTH